jgi:CHAT domain-containing protein/tetratricopeptide (TPR) repeat protein
MTRWLLVLAGLLAVATAARAAATYQAATSIPPRAEFSIEQELEGGQRHEYALRLEPGAFARLVVEQRGIDVVLAIAAPDGRTVAEVDRPNGAFGREAVSMIAEAGGEYSLTVQSLSKTAAAGKYRLTLSDLRPAEPGDERRLEAERAISEGESFRAQNTAEASRRAIEWFGDALRLWRTLGEPDEQAWALYGLGLSHRFLGEQERAIEHFTDALRLVRDLDDVHGHAMVQTALAWSHLYVGDNARALEGFDAALPLRHAVGDLSGEALTQHGIGWAHALLSSHEVALIHFRRSLALRRQVRDSRGEALTLVGIGKVLVELGERDEAVETLTAAADSLRAIGDRYGEGDALSQLGWAHTRFGDPARAQEPFATSLTLRRLTGDRAGEATTLYGIARAERDLGRPEAALGPMGSALQLLEATRGEGASQQIRMSYFASVQEYYQFKVDLLMELHERHPGGGYSSRAYSVHQRARARGLLDLLSEAHIDIREGVDPALLEQERMARQELSVAAERQRRAAGPGAPPDRLEAAAKSVAEAAQHHQAVEQRIRVASPSYASLDERAPLGAAEVQSNLLDDDTVLLEYALGEERSFIWVLTAGRLRSYIIPGRRRIEALVLDWHDALSARSRVIPAERGAARRERVRAADERVAAVGQLLSDLLLPPMADELRSRRRLVLVPHGLLHLVPFAALPVAPVPDAGRDGPVPLMADHEVVHLPSASALSMLRGETAGRPPAGKAVALFADPVFDDADERVRRTSGVATGRTTPEQPVNGANADPTGPLASVRVDVTPRLFATRLEAERIAAMVPAGESLVRLDFAASRDAALDPGLRDYRTLHFATHAFLDDVHPELSGILLSRVDAQGRAIDGFLPLHDLFTLRLRADLVVLSGCRTALGKKVEGEGLIGLSRGFFHAGVPRVVASLWAAEDKATAELMVRFYRGMFGPSRLSPAAALRAAQVEMWKDPRWRSPYYWAGFVLQGEWR